MSKRQEVEIVQIGENGPEKCRSSNFYDMANLNDWLAGTWLFAYGTRNMIPPTNWPK